MLAIAGAFVISRFDILAPQPEVDPRARTADPPPPPHEPDPETVAKAAEIAGLRRDGDRWVFDGTAELRRTVLEKYGVRFPEGVVPYGYIDWGNEHGVRMLTLLHSGSEERRPGEPTAEENLPESLLEGAIYLLEHQPQPDGRLPTRANVYEEERLRWRTFFGLEHYRSEDGRPFALMGRLNGDYVDVELVGESEQAGSLHCRAAVGALASPKPAVCRADLDGDGRIEIWVREFSPNDSPVAVYRESGSALVHLGTMDLAPSWERIDGKWALVGSTLAESYTYCPEAGNFQPWPDVWSFTTDGRLTTDAVLRQRVYPISELPLPEGCDDSELQGSDVALAKDGRFYRYLPRSK